MSVIYLLDAMDQSILSAVAPSIQSEFHLSDTQVGLTASAFVLVLAAATLPAGYLADRMSRNAIIGVGVALWSLATLFSGLARSFPQLLASRALLGIGESTYDPASQSLIGDWFSKTARGRAVSVLRASFAIGTAIGFIVGGLVAMKFGWRYAFYVAAGPGLLFAVLAISMREPLRGAAEAHGPRLRSTRDAGLRSFLRLLKIRSLRASIAALTLGFVLQGGVLAFLPIYLHRQLGVDLAAAGAVIGIPLLAGVLVGTPLGGWLVDWRARKTARAHLEVFVAATSIAAAAFLLAFVTRSLPIFVVGCSAGIFLLSMSSPALQALNQNIVVPSLRGSAMAMALVSATVLGQATGSLAFGIVSDWLHNLQLAFLVIGPTALALSAAFAAYGLPSVALDVAAAEESWAQRGLEPVR